MKRRMSLIAATVVCTLIVAAPAVQARASGGARHHIHSFEGTCEIEGNVHFSPPATYQQQILTVDYAGTGTCSGTLDGHAVSDAPVDMRNHVQSDGSCVRAQTLAPGPGSLSFDNGPTIAYTFEFTYVLSDGVLTFEGRKSGTAVGHGTFLTPRTPPDISVHCYDGTGIADIPMDLTLTTQSPLSSNRGE